MTLILVSVARSSVILLVGLMAAALLRKQPAAFRHSILAASLVFAAMQPGFNRILPAFAVPQINWMVDSVAPAAEVTVDTELITGAPAQAPDRSAIAVDWLSAVFFAWTTGVVASLLLLLLGMAWLMRLQSRARDAGSEWVEIEAAMRAQLGGHRRARIFITQHPAMIVTWGVVNPAILLPLDADAWSVDRKRLVVAHELAHLLRRDWLMQVIAEIARSINWFNPLFWIACARLRRESEHAADDLVLDTGITATSYASHLVELARALNVHGRTWLPAPSIARPSTLERRVRAMLNPQLNRRPVARAWQLAVMAVLGAIALPVAAASQASSTPAGTVSDPMGRPLADATIRLAPIGNPEQVFETKTDATGAFLFSAVPAGEYWLSLRYPGFAGTRQRMPLSGAGTTITLRAQVGTLQERITVSGDNGSEQRSTPSAAPPSKPACTPSPTGGQLIPPMKIRDVRPRYKQEWRDNRIEGEILMKATIGTDGKVRGVDVISPVNAELEDEAMAAVAQWVFTPTYLNCEPVEVQMYVTVAFKLP